MQHCSTNSAKDVAFLLLPGFSTLCLANAVEPYRAANTLADRTLYRRLLASVDGGAVASSSGIRMEVDAALSDLPPCDTLFVISSYGYDAVASPAFNARLLRAARGARVLAGLDTGAWLLARAGLLEGYEATIHWQELARLQEDFPSVHASEKRYVIDRDRITAGGATTVLDLMLRLIREDHGDALALDVMRLFLYDTERPDDGPQRGLPGTPSVAAAPQVAHAIAVMEHAVEHPVTLPEIARRVGCSQRQLERRFKAALGVSPVRYYRDLRLAAARRLMQESPLSLAEVAARCGFNSPAAFSRAFRQHFGTAPGEARRVPDRKRHDTLAGP